MDAPPPSGPGYADWNGPFEDAGPSADGAAALALRLQPHHLNTGARMHGALVMGMLKLAHERAARARLATAGGPPPLLASLQLDFVDAAAEGERVLASSAITRVTRSLVFVRGELRAGDRTVATGSSIFRRPAAMPPACAPASAQSAALPDGCGPLRARAPFSLHAGPVYEQGVGDDRTTVLPIGERHLHVDGQRADEGAALLLADLALGTCARDAARGAPCVALSMQLSCFGEVRRGDLLVARARLQGGAGGIQAIVAEFHVGTARVMAAAGSWKVLHAS